LEITVSNLNIISLSRLVYNGVEVVITFVDICSGLDYPLLEFNKGD